MKDKLIIAAALIILIAVVCTCNRCWVPRQPEVRTDTVYVSVHDTTPWYTPSITVIQGGQIPEESTKAQGIRYKVRVDSFIAYEKVFIKTKVDTAAILTDYYAKVFYRDTVKNDYGHVIIEDSVTQNRIAARRVLTDFKIPEITKTITEKPKRFGVGVQAGYGVFNNKLTPYVGVGFHYSFIKF